MKSNSYINNRKSVIVHTYMVSDVGKSNNRFPNVNVGT